MLFRHLLQVWSGFIQRFVLEDAVSDYDFSGVYTAMLVVGIAIGAVAVLLIVWLASHLHIAVRWI